jgi:CheY-like chemotaxis protein/nitrogen-specific signal transduction histidine kinase
VVVLRDITQQKHGERILKEAKEEAERANQAKSEFLSRMSHELRTPLNAILGFAQLLEMEDLRQENRESVEQILKGGRHLLELINEVLDITRIETGNISLSPEPVYVLDAVQQAMDLVRPLAAHRDIRLRVEPGDRRKRHVLADRQRLIQVLLNLLSNAVKYNRAKGSVTVGCQEIAGGKARLTVCDTGFGISEQDIEKLFSPFERLKADQAGVEGTGLGLALSRRLAEVMGGVLGVESRLGQGSTFWIELALVEDPLHRLEREDALTLAKTISGAERRAIVYIEDNLSNLRLMEQIFAERPEIKLIASMQGELGLDLAREHHPDLILLDLHLPDIPGEQVLRRLREDPGTRDIPVIVVSADATPRQIDRLLTAGAKEYLTKPLDIKKFLKVLDEHLKGSQTPVHSVN